MSAIHTSTIDSLPVAIYNSRKQLGDAAAAFVGARINEVLEIKDEVRIVFAAAKSQREFLTGLLELPDIAWEKVVAFQMDEYHTLPTHAPQRFSNFLEDLLFRFRKLKAVHYMTEDIKKYEELISEEPVDIVCMGIGENGHLAFNDPPEANFNDPYVIKEVSLDETCRQQQVNDGEFDKIDLVPKKAITLTIPTLLNADFVSVVVPGKTKQKAVHATLFNSVNTKWPSSILQKQSNAKLFLDVDSAALIMDKLIQEND